MLKVNRNGPGMVLGDVAVTGVSNQLPRRRRRARRSRGLELRRPVGRGPPVPIKKGLAPDLRGASPLF
jgi:hypothetical protein